MNYITLNNNVKMPILGLGTARTSGSECENMTLQAIECGYRLIDTAQMYENEREVGNAIKKSSINRSEIFVTTKICRPNNSYESTKSAIEKSLKELQMDYIDLLLIHEPYEESIKMYRAMKEAYDKGLVRAIGISNFNVKLYNDFIQQCGIIPAVNQVEQHVFFQQDELNKEMSLHGTHMQAWSSFANGKNNFFKNETLRDIGKKYNKTVAQIALRFLTQQGISVIPKSSNKNRLIENMDIFDFELTYEDIKSIKSLNQGETLFGWY